MKKYFIGLLIFSNFAIAADSTIETEIVKDCKLTGISGLVDFGNINPLTQDTQQIGYDTTADSPGHFKLHIICTKSTSLNVSWSSANNWKLKNGSEEISYNIKNKWNSLEDESTTLSVYGNGVSDSVSDRGLYFTVNKSMKPGTYTDTITSTWSW